ncbi:unnamed protein product [Arabidopsis lyrata]|nr:unnamed protein product [Arabidopsis lyrata]
MIGCSRLRTFPEISSNIKVLNLGDTDIEDVPPSVGCLSRLYTLNICSRSLKRLTHVPLFITKLFLNGSDIETIPDCVIGLTRLEWLSVERCTKLESIPGLPPSLKVLEANDCVSLKRVRFSFHNPPNVLQFTNCLKLDKESRRGIIQQADFTHKATGRSITIPLAPGTLSASSRFKASILILPVEYAGYVTRRGIIQKSIYDYVCLPGKKIPAEFTHKATGRSITIPLAPGTLSASSRFKACLLISPVKDYGYERISCSIRSKGGVTVHSCELPFYVLSFRSKHLFIVHGDLFRQRNNCYEVDVTMSEITFEFNHKYIGDKIIECGVQIMTEEAEDSSSRKLDNYETESSSSEVDSHETESSSSEVDSHETESSSSEVDSHETESSSSEVDSHETESSSSEDGNGDENIKTSKQTGFRSWLRKFFCLEEKKMNTTEGILMESHETKPVFCTLLHHLRKVGDREFRQDTDSPEIKTKSTQGDHTVPGCWSSALCCEHKKAKPLKEG